MTTQTDDTVPADDGTPTQGSQYVAVEKLAAGVFQLVVVRQENQDRAFVRV